MSCTSPSLLCYFPGFDPSVDWPTDLQACVVASRCELVYFSFLLRALSCATFDLLCVGDGAWAQREILCPGAIKRMDSRLSQFSEDGLTRSLSAPCLGAAGTAAGLDAPLGHFKLPFQRLPREGPQPGGGRLRRLSSDPVLEHFRAASESNGTHFGTHGPFDCSHLARPHTVPSWLSSEKGTDSEIWEPRNWGPSEKQQQAKRGLLARRKKTQALRERDQRRIQFMVDRRKDEREARLKRLVQASGKKRPEITISSL